jgi:outer membrane lipoprotein
VKCVRWLAIGLLLVVSGCGVLSKEVRREATPLRGFAELREDPQRFRGGIVILGGEIIEARNRADGTTLLVLERPLGMDESPKIDAASGGRFMVRFAEYLDPFLFGPGRSVTVAGKVLGEQTEAVGEAPYRYVLLEGVEIHLWKEPTYAPYPFWHPYDPWYPWWYDSRFGRRPWWW